jgi:hypothetical protein
MYIYVEENPIYSILPIAYRLLPIAYCLFACLPIDYCQLISIVDLGGGVTRCIDTPIHRCDEGLAFGCRRL